MTAYAVAAPSSPRGRVRPREQAQSFRVPAELAAMVKEAAALTGESVSEVMIEAARREVIRRFEGSEAALQLRRVGEQQGALRQWLDRREEESAPQPSAQLTLDGVPPGDLRAIVELLTSIAAALAEESPKSDFAWRIIPIVLAILGLAVAALQRWMPL